MLHFFELRERERLVCCLGFLRVLAHSISHARYCVVTASIPKHVELFSLGNLRFVSISSPSHTPSACPLSLRLYHVGSGKDLLSTQHLRSQCRREGREQPTRRNNSKLYPKLYRLGNRQFRPQRSLSQLKKRSPQIHPQLQCKHHHPPPPPPRRAKANPERHDISLC